MDNRELLLKSYKLKRDIIERFKKEENNKFLQILHISSAIVMSLFTLANLNSIANLYLVCSVIFIFTSYYCSYIEELRFTTENARDLTREINRLICSGDKCCLDNQIKEAIHQKKDNNSELDWLSLLLIKSVCVVCAHMMIVLALIKSFVISDILETNTTDCIIIFGNISVIYLWILIACLKNKISLKDERHFS